MPQTLFAESVTAQAGRISIRCSMSDEGVARGVSLGC